MQTTNFILLLLGVTTVAVQMTASELAETIARFFARRSRRARRREPQPWGGAQRGCVPSTSVKP